MLHPFLPLRPLDQSAMYPGQQHWAAAEVIYAVAPVAPVGDASPLKNAPMLARGKMSAVKCIGQVWVWYGVSPPPVTTEVSQVAMF